MTDNTKDKTIYRNSISKWMYMIKDYELVKNKKHPIDRVFWHLIDRAIKDRYLFGLKDIINCEFQARPVKSNMVICSYVTGFV